MTKFTKLSLIAALALAGTTASAQPLAEAIKNVEVSGTVTYRYDDQSIENVAGADGDDDSETSNKYKIAVNVNSKVNDDVTFNSRFILGENDGSGTDFGSLDTQASGDTNLDAKLTEANFAYTGIANTVVVVGKQAIPTAFTIDRDATGIENTGTGILAQTTFGPATLHAAYFNQTNFNTSNDTGLNDITKGVEYLKGSKDVITAGIALALGPVNVDASYVDVDDTFDAYTVGADAAFDLGEVSLETFARYSVLELDDKITDAVANLEEDNGLWKIGVSANMGMFGAHLMYGQTDEDGGTVGVINGATVGFDEHWNVTLDTVADADTIFAGVDAQVTDKINLALNYSAMDADKGSGEERDETEVYGQITYDHASNLSTFVRFGQYDVDYDASNKKDQETTAGRVQIQYSF